MKSKMKNFIYESYMQIMKNDIRNEYEQINGIKDKETLLNFIEIRLKELLLYSYRNVPYYKRILPKIGVIDNGNVNLSNFNNIPIITKKKLNENFKDFVSENYKERNWYYNYSGGSTGEPTKFIQDRYYFRWVLASLKYYRENMLNIDWNNITKIILWGSPRDLFNQGIGMKAKIANWLTNTTFLNSFKMSKKDMDEKIEIINKVKPDLIMGYAGSLFELCKYAESKNKFITSPTHVLSSAETLTNNMRSKIERVLSSTVYDFYGSRETACLAGECKRGIMHTFDFNNYIELLNMNDNPIKSGEKGRIIVTNLHNYSMPFIRYEIGDMATIGPKNCSCGNVLSTLTNIHGRLEEQFIKEDGSIIIGYFFVHLLGVVVNKGYISKFQIIQEDFKLIRIIAVLNEPIPNKEKRNIEEKIKVQMGKDCEINWEFVDEIPKTKSGKYLYTRSLINN